VMKRSVVVMAKGATKTTFLTGASIAALPREARQG